MLVYKHTKTIEYVKNQPTFSEKYKLCGSVTRKVQDQEGGIFWVMFLFEFEEVGIFPNLNQRTFKD